MHLVTKREGKSNPRIPGVFLFSIWFTFVSLVPTTFHGFGNCEDLVTGASEAGDISKIKRVSGMFSFVFGFWVFFICGQNWSVRPVMVPSSYGQCT